MNYSNTMIPRFLRAPLLAAVLAAAIGAMPLSVHAQPSVKTDMPLTTILGTKSRQSVRVPVILAFQGDLTQARRLTLIRLGVTITSDLPLVHSVAAQVPIHELRAVTALPFVSHLSSDGEVRKCDLFTVGSSEAAAAWQRHNVSGAGVGVAVIDSGILNCDDLNASDGRSRIIDSQNFVTYNPSYSDPCGHGTHVSGIIAGNGTDSGSGAAPITRMGMFGCKFTQTYSGIAPGANLINLRALDEVGCSTVSVVISAIQYAVTNKTKDNIRVINLSLGHPVGESYTTDPLCQACEAAWKAGIVVVCAAGNSGRLNLTQTTGTANEGWGTAYGSIQSPGNDPYVITVGASKSMDGNRADDRIATYSSRGPSRLDMILKPDIIAPGNQVVSLYSFGTTLYQWNTANANGLPVAAYTMKSSSSCFSTDYFILSGTSMAAPVVSGAVALMLQANPSLTPDTVKARLMASADKWKDPAGNTDPLTYGAGYLNIPAAIASTVTVTRSALSPSVYHDANNNIYISTSVIGTSAIWGNSAIWGTGAIWGNSAIWGTSTQIANSSSAIWGTSAIWGNSAIWGTTTSAVDLSSIALHGE